MTDPFEALRAPDVATDPDPAFANRLRARIRVALEPRGPTMATRTPRPDTAEDAPPRPASLAYVSLWVPDVERAAAFFGAVLGWSYAPGSGAQGRQVEGVTPRHGLWGGQERSTLFLCVAVDDVGAAATRVRAGGGQAGVPREEPYGLIVDCVDDEGLAFAMVQSAAEQGGGGAPAPGERPGELAYVVLEMTDSERSRAFYGSVLGWRFSPGRIPGGWNVEDVAPPMGMAAGQDPPTIVPMYRVDDIAAAVERVRDAGGGATDPERQPYGVSSSCTDDQGTRFYLASCDTVRPLLDVVNDHAHTWVRRGRRRRADADPSRGP